ncbi:uncharacterized protein BKA78DRAFT_153484 [Phyllosticta capitalensis]|uniref:uncharacterized protein n=1 Tax=Phyllosticta capitalensis TaxID=121624 RepID=UPI00312D3240
MTPSTRGVTWNGHTTPPLYTQTEHEDGRHRIASRTGAKSKEEEIHAFFSATRSHSLTPTLTIKPHRPSSIGLPIDQSMRRPPFRPFRPFRPSAPQPTTTEPNGHASGHASGHHPSHSLIQDNRIYPFIPSFRDIRNMRSSCCCPRMSQSMQRHRRHRPCVSRLHAQLRIRIHTAPHRIHHDIVTVRQGRGEGRKEKQ